MSGVTGFYGEGYRYHRVNKRIMNLPILRWFLRSFGYGFDFAGSTFCAKTTTWLERVGNMPLDEKFEPKEFLPRCIFISWWQWLWGVCLNAVGLSGPGAEALLSTDQTGRWQDRTESFILSYMSTAEDQHNRQFEFRLFVRRLMKEEFGAPILLQDNESCPNVHFVARTAIVEQVIDILDIAKEEGFPYPIVIKICAGDTSPEEALEISKHPMCAGFCVTNTYAFGHKDISTWKWRLYFPSSIFTGKSPLEKRGFSPGGYSGRDLLPLVEKWVLRAREIGMTAYINAGGGILKPSHVDRLWRAGANSVSIGSVAFLRPWRLNKIIQRANDLGWSVSGWKRRKML